MIIKKIMKSGLLVVFFLFLMEARHGTAQVEKVINASGVEEKKVEFQNDPRWQYGPIVQIFKTGDQFQVVVEPNLLMNREDIPAIQSIRINNEKGNFLGLKTFNQKDTKWRGEFMINPEETKVEKIQVIVVSASMGEWRTEIPFEETKEPQMTVYYTPPPPEEKAAAETADSKGAKEPAGEPKNPIK